MIKISVVIPCYNEEKILPKSIEMLEKFFFRHRNKFAYELIFVDDGSDDNTLKVLELYQKSGKNIIIETYPCNIGKGYAIRKGLYLANHDDILILDADLSVRPDELLSIEFNEIKSPFIIKGERKYVVPQTPLRIFLGKGFSILHKIWLRLPLWDTQCPFAFLHNVPKEFVNELKVDGFAYDLELLYMAKKRNINVHSIKVSYHNVEDSRVTIRKTIQMFFDLIKIRFIQ